MKPIKRLPTYLVVALAGAGLVLATSVAWIGLSLRPDLAWPREQFSSQEWLRTPAEERHRFAKDLLNGRLLVGKTREEAKAILGPPSSEYGGRFSTYTVGYPATFAITLDSVYFVRVEFDDSDCVRQVTLGSD